MSLYSASFDCEMRWGEIPSATVILINAGATPAYNVRIGGALFVRDFNHQIRLGTLNPEIAAAEIGPQCKHKLAVSLSDSFHYRADNEDTGSVISTEDYVEISDKGKAMFIGALVMYDDAFGNEQTLRVLLKNDGLNNLMPTAEAKPK